MKKKIISVTDIFLTVGLHGISEPFLSVFMIPKVETLNLLLVGCKNLHVSQRPEVYVSTSCKLLQI